MKETWLTDEGFKKIRGELEYVKSTLPEMENTIKMLRGYGFNREDEALKESIEQRDFLKERIQYLTEMLTTAKRIG